jgi:PAS domain S-box-containing protein
MTFPGYNLVTPICGSGDLFLYQATRTLDDVPVLLKIPASSRPTAAVLRRLEHECELARDLDSRRIARPLALERQGGDVALVLEPGPTRTLASLLGAPMDVASFLRIAIGMNAALADLHRHELIHKDLKPEHVLLNDAGDVWLTGLGIASRLPRERQSPEPPETIAGTLAYMAPEQTGRVNRSIDSRSDMYALGTIFYQMITGVLPFAAADPMEWIHCHIARQPISPIERVPSLPELLSELVMKLMAKSAEDRYQSAGGLDADLRHCLAQWESSGRIDLVPLGTGDVPDRLLIPETLYGRKAEVDTLLAAFDRVVVHGAPELVLVSGYSGVGKTSVVHELHKALVQPHGLFAAGKFDQYKRDIPFATLVQALRTLIRQILGKSEAEVAAWKESLQEAVSPNGQVIVSLIPEVELIIGPQPPVADLPPQEAKNRFRLVLLRFIGVFARKEHPLALFLDDLQWLDAATLELIEYLMTGQDVRHLLLIGAYRDNEVGPTHPLMRIIEAIRKAGTGLREVVLAPLAIDDVDCLVADSLHCDRERALPLAELMHEKTGGNPFFVIQLLTVLAEEKLLAFDPGAGAWVWDLTRIHAKGFTDNVVDLMIGKLNRLQVKSKESLTQLACLGSKTRLATLARVQERTKEDVGKDLLEAIRAGFLFQQDDCVSFLHDRVQEAAYALIPEEKRPEAHLKIGRTLLAQAGPEELSDTLFDIANHLNRGAGLMTDPAEKAELAELNTNAGRRARASIAYATARDFFAAAIALLPTDAWDTQYALTFALHLELAECKYLCGALDKAESLFVLLLARAKSPLDQVKVYELQLALYQVGGRYDDALAAGLRALHLLGVDIPENDAAINEAIRAEATGVAEAWRDRQIAALATAPEVSDPRIKTVIAVLSNSNGPAYIGSRPQLFPLINLMNVNNSLRFGPEKGSCEAYAAYGFMLASIFGDAATGYAFSDMAMRLSERFNDLRAIGATHYIHGNHVNFWVNPIATDFPVLERGFDACLNSGNLVFANYIAYSIVWQAVERGDTLADVLSFSQKYASFALDSRNEATHQSIVLEQQFLKCLMGETSGSTKFSDAAVNELSCVEKIAKASFTCGVMYFHTMKTLVAYLMEDDVASRTYAEEAKKLLAAAMGQPMEAMFYFLHALVLTRACRQSSAAEREELRGTLATYQEKLASWSQHCPANFASKHALVAAEIAEIEGNELSAERLFEQAIESARNNGFVHWEAMANEAAARFYESRGFKTLSRAHLREAHACYSRWGAQGKVRQLEQRSPQLREASFVPTSTSPTAAAEIDHLAVVQASRAISGEIRLDALLKTLMRTVLNTAGAGQGYLLLIRKEGLSMAAEARVDRQNVMVQVHSDPGLSEALFPVSILNYVRRSSDKVLLENAAISNPYSADDYFSRRHPKSVLCFPITKQTHLIGLFYLENDLSTHAFTHDRLAVLELIAAQAAIALENALVYEALRQNEQKFRAIFDQTFQLIGLLSMDGRILQINQTALQLVGVSEGAVLGKPFWETPWWAHSAELQEKVRLAVQRAAGGQFVRFETTHTTPDGRVAYVDFSLKPVPDGEGRVAQLIAEGRDITERQQAEVERVVIAKQLEAVNILQQSLLEPVPLESKLASVTQTIVEHFKADFCRIWLIRPGDRCGQGCAHAAVSEGPHVCRHREKCLHLLASAGRYTHTEGGHRRVPFGCYKIGKIASGTDHKLISGDVVSDPRIHNHEWASTLGLVSFIGYQLRVPGAESIGVLALFSKHRLQPSEDAMLDGLSSAIALAVQQAAADEALHRSRDELEIRVEQRTIALTQSNQNLKDEVVERRKAEAERVKAEAQRDAVEMQLRQAQKLQAVGQLAAGIAHEINTPIQFVNDSVSFLRDGLKDLLALVERSQQARRDLAQGESLEKVEEEMSQAEEDADLAYLMENAPKAVERSLEGLDRVATIVRSMKEFAHPDGKEMASLDLNRALQTALTVARNEYKYVADVRTEFGELPLVTCYAGELNQVFLNIIVNAAHAIQNVVKEPGQRGLITVRTQQEGDWVVISIGDTGGGIPPEIRDRIYDPFFTTKEVGKGTGQGLAIAWSVVVDKHGGKLWFENTPGNGTTFFVRLPVKSM